MVPDMRKVTRNWVYRYPHDGEVFTTLKAFRYTENGPQLAWPLRLGEAEHRISQDTLDITIPLRVSCWHPGLDVGTVG